MIDITVTMNEDGTGSLAHRPDCEMVQRHRLEGKPLMTMFGCDEPLSDVVKLHQCLKKAKPK
jgi:hypothetical protein